MGFTAADLHIDAPLTNLVIGFEPEGFIVDQIFPQVPVNKQSDKYYVWEKGEFFRIPQTQRSPKTKGNEVVFNVGSDSYFADNYALRHEESFEAMANADQVLSGRQKRVRAIKSLLHLDWEDRVARQIQSGSNLGSFTTLSGVNQWNDFTNSNPLDDVDAAIDSIRSSTGKLANLMIVPYSVSRKLRRHPELLELKKFVEKGVVSIAGMQEFFSIPKILIGNTIKNTGEEGHTNTFVDVWGKTVVVAYVTNGPDPDGKDPSLGYSFRWNAPLLGGQPMAAEIWNDPDGGNFENRRVQYYQDEKIAASELGYAIVDAIA